MVVAAFPFAKLLFVFMKQISKPIANYCTRSAKSSPTFRRKICIPPARAYNWCEVRMKMWMLNLGKPVNIPVLNEAMAIELGASLLSEAILLFIACALVFAEYNRSVHKEEKVQRVVTAEKNELNRQIKDLFNKTEHQFQEMVELRKNIKNLERQVLDLKKNSTMPPTQPPKPPTPPPTPQPAENGGTSLE